MTALNIRRIILYKHGVGYFERRGEVSGDELRLHFPLAAMDDVLKSLIALDLGAGQVLSIDFETPEDREALLEKGSIHLSDNRSLLDLLRDLRGRPVRCRLFDQQLSPEQSPTLEGVVIGIDHEATEVLRRALLSLYQPEQRQVVSIPVMGIRELELLDDGATADLGYFLRATRSEEERRSATLHLSPGEHRLLVGYIAPAPSWRVSYRMLYEAGEGQEGQQEAAPSVLLQGWGLFDNQLDEDLHDVQLTLVAGMPISFRYRLYEPKIPERPLIEDEERTVSAPVFFEAPAMPQAAPASRSRREVGEAMARERFSAMSDAEDEMGISALSIAEMEESLEVAARGDERGALFAYHVSHPVSVARGQSAMVPILSQKLACRRDLLYNGRKLPKHPVASLRLTNDTGLTLERGPVTVLEDGDYAGEAVLPFTRAGGEVIIPFAVELGITVEEQHTSERRIASVSVRGDYLQVQEYDMQDTTYHLTSTLTQPVEVLIEHTPHSGYELTDTPEPAETSARFKRWNVACAAGTHTRFKVTERMLQSRREQVRSLTGKHLHYYLKNRFLDAATIQALEGVLRLYHEVEETKTRIGQLIQDRQAIYNHQKQIQGNLAPLGREGDEGTLRRRYVAELNQQEDRLKALAADEERMRQHIAALEQQAQQQLQGLHQRQEEQQ